MHRLVRIAPLVCLLAGCQGPGAAFVGEYAGTMECEGSFRGSGAPYSEGPVSRTVTIDETPDGAIFIAGDGCTTWLSPLSDMQASAFSTTACRVALDDPPVTYSLVSTTGTVQRRGELLSYTLTLEILFNEGQSDEDTADVTCRFDGDRI